MRRPAERSPELDLRADDAENQTEAESTAPRLIVAGDPAMAEMPDLIRAAFASMGGVIDPPSPRPHLTPEMRAALPGEVRAMGVPVVVCVMLTTAPAALCIGKLTVSAQAREMGLTQPALQARAELVATQATFPEMGFVPAGRTPHPGYDRCL